MIFKNIEESEKFKCKNFDKLNNMFIEVSNFDTVNYCEIWLNSKCPSFVAGFNQADEMIVCLPINAISLLKTPFTPLIRK